MKRQTALQWLLEQWPILQSQLPSYVIEEALQMEREQIIEAYVNIGFKSGYDYAIEMKKKAEQYYGQKFGEKFGGQDENGNQSR